MAQQQNDNLNQMPTNENSFMNDVTGKNYPQNGGNIDPSKKGKPVGPNGNNAPGPVGMPPQHDASNMHLGPYSHPMQHHHMPPELEQQQQPMEHMYNPQGPPYGRYHDPNMPPMDIYNRYHPGGIEMKMPPNRPPPQRYPQQQPQASASNQPQPQTHGGHPQHPGHGGPNEQVAPQQSQQPPNPIGQTPTLNSLLQSHQTPQPHQHHRYEQQSQQPGPQQPMQYGAQAWNPTGAPQQRPATYNPGLGQQAYRPPPPPNAYPPRQIPYPQRYPTPPGASGPNHRPNHPWPPPANSHAHPNHPTSPHQSPVHAPSPSPQPPQPANSPHQDPIGQNSNDSSNAAAVASSNSMAMRPTPSPTGSSGSRSMSPAIGPNALINSLPPQGMPPYGSQSQQFPQGNYPTRPQYPANYGQVNGPANVPNQNQYGRPMPNQAQYAPQSNYPTPPSPHMHSPYKPVNGPAPPNPGSGSPRLATHLKHHLLQKGYGNQSPTSPQSFVNGPGMHQPMGPPQMQHVRMQAPGSMGPPYSPHHNSQAANTHQGLPPPENLDNGINSSGSSASSQHPVTSIITTGPDGTNIDEASQQSTISNASAASDDPQCSTPKRKADGYNHSHLASAGNTSSMHEDFELGSPWPRAPASPAVNSHPEPTPHRSSSKTKSDSLSKLYEMDENPERRPWLDKLLSFMEERRTPITACPTISKQPLDLYRLYSLAKERGGFVEVCNVTKSKIWKDIAGMLGIGASSSAAYTLRKHYTKNLLAFECHFDRGGIDPLPIIQQVESGSKKKAPKVASAPSPDANHKGSSNSQDSFQQAQIQSPPGSSSTSMDSYNSYPPPSQIQQPPVVQQQIPPPQQQTQQPAGSNAPNVPSPNVPQTAQYQPGQQPYNQYPVEQQQYGPQPPGQQQPFQQPQQGQFPAQNRYPPYAEAPESMPPQRPYSQHQPPQHHAPAPHASQPTNAPSGPPTAPIGTSPTQYPSAPIQSGPPQPMHNSSNYPQMHNSPNLEYRPQEPPTQQRRHPDFGGAAPYPGPFPASTRSPYPNTTPQHYNRSQFPPQAPQWANQRMPGPGYPQWNEQVSGRSPENRMPNEGENKMRIFSQQIQPPPPHQWNQPPMGNVPGNAIRPPQRHPVPGKQMTMVPQQVQHHKPGSQPFPGTSIAKRDIVFPSDSVEAVTPLLYRRKRLSKQDIGQTEIWRIFMCLQSGLLSESTWALDVLNILLFDDSSIQYFGLTHLPGLLTLLLDHFQKSLTDMFDSRRCNGRPAKPQLKPENTKRTNNNEENGDDNDAEDDDGLLKDNVNDKAIVDLGQVTNLPNPNDRIVVLHSTTNYTMCSRKGIPVKIKEADDDIFILDTKRCWDVHSVAEWKNEQQTSDHVWSYGHLDPEPYKHIIDPFMGEFVDIPFAKYLKRSDRKRKASSDASNSDENTTNTTTTATTKTNNNKHETNSANDGDNSKTNVNNPKASVKEEKIDDSTDEPRIVEKVSADVEKESKDRGITAETETVESEQMDVDVAECDATKDKAQSPNMDSDCREVDMELEKIPNGPKSNEASASDNDNKKTKNDETKSEDATSAKPAPSFDVKKTVQDPAETLKRRRAGDFEDECYARDEASLYLISETQDTLARRCISISNILRNLTFVPGNETVFANSETFLAILGRILLLHHKHPARTQSIRNYDREDDTDFSDSCSSLQGENEWWWDYLVQLRENVMVAVANIAGHMQLAKYDELIARPCLDGLLHWAICPSAHGQDPFPSNGPHSVLSPQRLALEALCKICVTDANVDLVIATPPFSRLENLCSVLTRHLCRNEDQVLREFSVNLLHYLAAADSSMARTVAMQSPCISYLVAFIEQAEQTALGIANQHGINYLRDNPDAMGTSLDMLRRTAGTLLHLARHPDNRPLFLQQEQRLLGLVMSHILDQQVALIISRVLFQISRGTGSMSISESMTSPVKRMKKRILPPPPSPAHSNPNVNETSIAVS